MASRRTLAAIGASISLLGAAGLSAVALVQADANHAQKQKYMYLTFDDGPSRGDTPYVLDRLRDKRLHATFFMRGVQMVGAPDLARRAEREGNVVGLHGYHHWHYSRMSQTQQKAEIDKAIAVYTRILGHAPKFWRFPYLDGTDYAANYLHSKGIRTVYADITPGDWALVGQAKINKRIDDNLRRGSVVLLHDGNRDVNSAAGAQQLRSYLPYVLEYQAHRWRFRTL